MNWNTEVQKSEFNATEKTEATMSDRSQQRGGSATQAHNVQSVYSGGHGGNVDLSGNANSIIGMRISEVSPMIRSIEDYCDNIMKKIRGIEENTDTRMAFKGQGIDEALKSYIQKVEDYGSNLVSQLKAFCDKLKDAEKQWIAATEAMSGTINSTESNFATGTEYHNGQA